MYNAIKPGAVYKGQIGNSVLYNPYTNGVETTLRPTTPVTPSVSTGVPNVPRSGVYNPYTTSALRSRVSTAGSYTYNPFGAIQDPPVKPKAGNAVKLPAGAGKIAGAAGRVLGGAGLVTTLANDVRNLILDFPFGQRLPDGTRIRDRLGNPVDLFDDTRSLPGIDDVASNVFPSSRSVTGGGGPTTQPAPTARVIWRAAYSQKRAGDEPGGGNWIWETRDQQGDFSPAAYWEITPGSPDLGSALELVSYSNGVKQSTFINYVQFMNAWRIDGYTMIPGQPTVEGPAPGGVDPGKIPIPEFPTTRPINEGGRTVVPREAPTTPETEEQQGLRERIRRDTGTKTAEELGKEALKDPLSPMRDKLPFPFFPPVRPSIPNKIPTESTTGGQVRQNEPPKPPTKTPTGCSNCEKVTQNMIGALGDLVSGQGNALNTALNTLNTGLNATQLGLLRQIDDKLGPQVTGGLSGAIGRVTTLVQKFARSLHLDKVLNMLTFATVLHNAAMLSGNLAQTLGDVTSTAINTLIIRDENEEQIDVNQILGQQFNQMMSNVLGQEVWTGVKVTWNKANRIVQTASNIIWSIRSIADSAREIQEWIGENTGKIGNALKRARVVPENAYGWMPERFNSGNAVQRKLQRMRDNLEPLDDAANSLQGVLGEVTNITQEVNELRENKQAFDQAVQSLTPANRPENTPVKTAANTSDTASVSPTTTLNDRAKAEG